MEKVRAAGVLSLYSRDHGSLKYLKESQVGLESSELLVGRQGHQTMQGFGSLAKDFCFHPKSNEKLLDRF